MPIFSKPFALLYIVLYIYNFSVHQKYQTYLKVFLNLDEPREKEIKYEQNTDH